MAVSYVAPPPVDLQVVNVAGPTAAQDGATVDVSWQVRNLGPQDAEHAAWTDVVYVAANGDWNQRRQIGRFTYTGGLEAGKSYTRTERFRMEQHIQGAYEFFVETDARNSVVETDEGNNVTASLEALQVSLTPRPDLQVDSLVIPATVTSGNYIDVEFTVRNLGPVRTPTGGARWYDGVYLSLNNTLDAGDRLLGSIQNGAALEAAGDAYSSSGTFKIDLGVGGNVYIIVKADIYNAVDEYPDDGNNTDAAQMAVDVTPVPPPDLVVSDVWAPAEAFDASSINIHYKVTNQGAGITYPGYWTDTVWLTTDLDRPDSWKGDIRLGSFNHDGPLEVGEFYTQDVGVTLPEHISGEYYLMVWSDAYDRVYEQAFDINVNPDAPHDLEGSNFRGTPLTVLYTPPADLEVMDVQAPATAVGGEQVSLAWTVANNGQNITDLDQWADKVWVSTDADLYDDEGEQWCVFGVPHYGKLEPGNAYSQEATFTLPPGADGDYFIVETNVDPEFLLSDEVLLQKEVGEIIARANDALEGRSLEDLTRAEMIQILVGPGGAEVVFEGPWTENNALAAASDIQARRPDLLISDVTVLGDAFSGEPVEVRWTVSNIGEHSTWWDTRYWQERVYVSPDAEFHHHRATYLKTVTQPSEQPLEPGESYTTTAMVSMPEGYEGEKFLHVFVDRDPRHESIWGGVSGLPMTEFPRWPEIYRTRVFEDGQKANNYANAPLDVTYREPDLQVTEIDLAAAAQSSQVLPISWTVTNEGTRTTRVDSWIDRVYISMDASLDTYDKLLGEYWRHGELAPGESYDVSAEVRLPDAIEGEFYILVYVDSPYERYRPGAYDPPILPYPSMDGSQRIVLPWNANPMGYVHEFLDEGNDIIATPMDITRADTPDLVVSDVTPPTHAVVGRGFELTFEVTNAGGVVPDTQTRWTDRIYLSRDEYLDIRSDHYVGSVTREGVLDAGESYAVTGTWNVPRGLLGDYYVFILTDVPSARDPLGKVYETTGEANNASPSAVPMIIELPPPGDLQVDDVTVPTAATVGDEIEIEWTVSNHHAEESVTGIWDDAVYLSADAVWDLGDVLVGRTRQGSFGGEDELDFFLKTLAPGESYTAQLTATLPPTLPGDYRLILRTDVFDDIHEGANNANNKFTSAASMGVDVNPMYLNTPVDDHISTGASVLHRIDVTAGETLEVELDAVDDHAANELYVRYEGLPSSMFYDAMHEGHLWADQTARVPSTQEGTYYVLVRGQGGSTPITLTARTLPFALEDVTPDTGGDDRYVTMTLRGAKFDPDSLVKLVRPQIAEYEAVNYEWIDATEIQAVFDLRDAPHGLYDVYVINPDGSESVLPHRYLVESAQPLDLTVGMGGPSELGLGETGWYGFGIYSLSNIDAPYVHFEFGMPNITNARPDLIPGPALVFRTNLYGEPTLDDVPWADLDPLVNTTGDNMAPGFTYDFVNRGYAALTFTADVYPQLRELLAEAPEYMEENFSVLDLADLDMQFYMVAAATPMTAEEYVAYQRDEALAMREAILADEDAPSGLRVAVADADLWAEAYLAALSDAGLLRPEDEPPAIREQPEFQSLMGAITAGILGTEAGADVIADGDLVAFFDQVKAWYGHDETLSQPAPYELAPENLPDLADYDLDMTHTTHSEVFIVTVRASEREFESIQPEEADLSGYFGVDATGSANATVTPPEGVGEQDFIPLAARLPYTVEFEQGADSDEIVSEIRVMTQLDEDLDLRTFYLGDIQLGDIHVHLPSDRAAFHGDFDFVDELGIVLRVTAGVDVFTGIALWELTAIDPLTGLPVEDPSLGLLRPNIDRTNLGSVSYTIRSWRDVTTGTEVESSARVFFDGDAPVETDAAVVTVDAVAPTTTTEVVDLGNGSYRLSWAGTDDATGSGVASYTVYTSVNGEPYSAWLRRTTDTEVSYEGDAGEAVSFIVLASDLAGNVEAGPAGVTLPAYNPAVNLGAAPTSPEIVVVDLPTAAASDEPVTNPLFLEALLGVPGPQSSTNPSSFTNVFEPFMASAFAWGLPDGSAGLGAMSMAVAPDGGSVLVSGGFGRNQLWRFDLNGGEALEPLATLDLPVYDMAYDGLGQLWATTGGGPLVQLDAETGQILERFGDGVNLGLAADGENDRLFVSTSDGVEVFDTVTHTWNIFSSTRVNGLGLSNEGELWGVSWPDDGDVVRFNRVGNAEVVARFDDPATGIAFGAAGTPLEGLSFVTHATGGELTMIDLVTFQSVDIAIGGARGQFLHTDAAGRLYVAQSDQVDVIQPITNPRIVDGPEDGALLDPRLTSLTVSFDIDMAHASALDAFSVTNPLNYTLRNLATDAEIEISTVTYSQPTRTARLWFEALLPDTYELIVSTDIYSETGLPLDQPYISTFEVLADVTDLVDVTITNLRANRGADTITFEASVTNTADHSIYGPMRLVFDGLASAGADLLSATGYDDAGHPFVTILHSTYAELPAGATTASRTVVVENVDWTALDLEPRVAGTLPPNEPPAITTTPSHAARSGNLYTYDVDATDPEGSDLTYVLTLGPDGAVIDPDTGVISWTPDRGSADTVLLQVRAYDARGGYDMQKWHVTVADVNNPPEITMVEDQQLAEGDELVVLVEGFDLDGDSIHFWADDLPGGAYFDVARSELRWQTDGRSAGRYRDVTIFATDGYATVSRPFEILVTNVNAAPDLAQPAPRSVQEGRPLTIALTADDADGDAITFGARGLPAGARIDPVTGIFTWTPDFTQHGEYAIELLADDGEATTSRTLDVEVTNVNAPVRFESLGDWIIYEGQPLSVVVGVDDPDYPGTPADTGEQEESDQPVAPLTWTHSSLPTGATFDDETGALRWTPDFTQAGDYSIDFTVTDDGDGTGSTTSDAITLTIDVRDANAAPQITEIDTQTLPTEGSLDIPVTATDADADTLTLGVEGLPAFATFSDNGDGTGNIHVEPGSLDRGDTMLTVMATDTGNAGLSEPLTGESSFILSVTASNLPPVMRYVGDKVAVVGEELVIEVHVDDLDEDDLTFGATGLPAGATFSGTEMYGIAEFRWTPAAVGTHSATLEVTDSGNGVPADAASDSETIALVARAANAAPLLTPMPVQSLSENETLRFALDADDPDGDPITFDVAGLPTGATFDRGTGVFEWTPNYFQAGQYTLSITAGDGQAASRGDVVIEVDNVNRPPVLTPLYDQFTREGTYLVFEIAGGDYDNDPLGYHIDGVLPRGASFDPETLAFEWTPDHLQAGSYPVTFVATDPSGLTDEMDVTIDVVDVNQAPVLPELSGHVVLVGETFELDLPGGDPDGDPVTYSAEHLPAGAALDADTGRLTWTPFAPQVGQHQPRIRVSDGELTAWQNLTLVASPEAIPPDVHVELTPSFAGAPGQPVLVHVTARGVADIADLTLHIDGEPITLDRFNRAGFTPRRTGHFDVTATAADVDGYVGTAQVTMKVRDPVDDAAPVVDLAIPRAGAIVAETLDVIGTVDDVNLDEFTLSLAPLGSRNFVPLAQSTAAVTGGVLAPLDPQRLRNGAYQLRLEAADISGRRSRVDRFVEINSADKSGALTRHVTDLTTSVAGVTLTLGRNYHGLDATVDGEVGYGWSLAGFEPRIATNLAPTGGEDEGVFAALHAGDRVYLNLPDGSRAGFTFAPTLHEHTGRSWYSPAWTADPGVDYQLVSADASIEQVGEAFHELRTGLPYNPASGRFAGADYTLVAADGTLHEYDVDDGLQAIVAPGGERLLVADSGVIGPDGSRVSFMHDHAGRLTDLVGSDGQRVTYTYDGSGRLINVTNVDTQARTWYGYDAAGRLTSVMAPAPADSLAAVYDADGLLAGAVAVDGLLGTVRDFVGDTAGGSVAAGATQRFALTIGADELATSGTGRVTFGIDVTGSGGFDPAAAGVQGLTAGETIVEPGHSRALFTVDRPGPYVIELSGADALTSGGFTLGAFIAGDVDSDGDIDADDQAAAATADINGDGAVDADDQQYLDTGFGFVANLPPTAVAGDLLTHVGLQIWIDLDRFASDAEGDNLDFAIGNVTHGTAELTVDGRSVLFTPEATFAGAASFDLQAVDPDGDSNVSTVTINVSDAPLLELDFAERMPRIDAGDRARMTVIGDFADEEDVVLPAAYLTFASDNAASGFVSRNGRLVGITDGYGVISVEARGIEAVTAFMIGEPADQDDADLARYGLYVLPDAIAMSSLDGEQALQVYLPDGTDVAGDVQTQYFIGNDAVIDVDAGGLITPLADGVSTVTVIHKMSEWVVRVLAESPVDQPPAPTTLDAAGGLVHETSADILFGVPAGGLSDASDITITPMTADELSRPVVAPFEFVTAFNLDLSGARLNERPQLSLPADPLAAGSTLVVHVAGQIPDATGAMEDAWLQVEVMGVGDDGVARTTSPLGLPGLLEGGEYWVAYAPDDAFGRVSGAVNITSELADTSGGTLASVEITDGASDYPEGDEGDEALAVAFGAWFVWNSVNLMNANGAFEMHLPVGNHTMQMSEWLGDGGNAKTVSGVEVIGADGTALTTTFDNVRLADVDRAHQPVVTSLTFAIADLAGETRPTLAVSGPMLWLGAPLGVGDDPADLAVVFRDTTTQREFVVEADDASLGNWDGATETLTVAVPDEVVIGMTTVTVRRKQKIWRTDGDGNRVVADVERFSPPVMLQPESRYTFVATGHRGTVAAFDSASEFVSLTADIPVRSAGGQYVRPRSVSVTPDGTRAYVALRGAAGVAMIDAVGLHQVDIDLDREGMNVIDLPDQASAYWLETDPAGEFLYVSDEVLGRVYQIDIQPGSAMYNQVVGTIEVPLTPFGLRGLAASASGKRLYVAAPGETLFGAGRRAGQQGYVHVVDISRPSDPRVIGQIAAGKEITHVATSPTDPYKIAFADKVSDLNGAGFIQANASETNWTVKHVELTLGSRIDWFDINNATGVVFHSDTDGTEYAFLAGFNAMLQGVPSHDVTLYPTKEIGANIGIIRDPFGEAKLLGATQGVENGFLDNLAISANGQFLLGGYRGAHGVISYDIRQLIDTANANVAGLQNQPIDFFNPDVLIDATGTGANSHPQGLDTQVISVTLDQPDLVVASFTPPPVEFGERGATAQWSVTTVGAAPLWAGSSWTERLYMKDAGGNRYLLGEFAGSDGNIGQMRAVELDPVPEYGEDASMGVLTFDQVYDTGAGDGMKWVLEIDATQTLIESNEANNTADELVQWALPDLYTESIVRPFVMYDEVLEEDFRYTIENTGSGDLPEGETWTQQVWLGTDDDVFAPDNSSTGTWHRLIEEIEVTPADLPAGGRYSGSFRPDLTGITLPTWLEPEDVAWVVITDATANEPADPRAAASRIIEPHDINAAATSNNKRREGTVALEFFPLRVEADGWSNVDETTVQASGRVDIGFKPEDPENFVPIVHFDGTSFTYNRETKLVSADGTLSAFLYGEQFQLFQGTWSLNLQSALSSTVNDQLASLPNEFKLGGADVTVQGLEFFLPDGANPADGELRLQGQITLPDPVNWNIAVTGEDNYIGISRHGLSFNRLGFTASEDYVLDFDGFEVVADAPWIDYIHQEGGASVRALRMGGEFKLPAFGETEVNLKKSNDPKENGYFQVSFAEATPKVDFVGNINVKEIALGADWKIEDLKLNVNTVAMTAEGEADLKGPDAAHLQMSLEVGQETSFSLKPGQTDQSPDFILYGIGVEVDTFGFTSDRVPDVGEAWDPEFSFAGQLSLPESLVGEGRSLTMQIEPGKELLINLDGIDFKEGQLGVTGLYTVPLFDLVEVEIKDPELKIGKDATTRKYWAELRTEITFNDLQNADGTLATVDLSGDKYVKLTEGGGLAVNGELTMPGPINITPDGLWAIEDIILHVNIDTEHPEHNKYEGTARAQVGAPNRYLGLTAEITPDLYSFKVESESEGDDFSVYGLGVKVASLEFVSDRDTTDGLENRWDPELTVQGRVSLPTQFTGGHEITVSVDGDDHIVINRDGVDVSGGVLALPGNQTFNLLGKFEVETRDAQLVFQKTDDFREVTVQGAFTFPTLNDTRIDLAVNEADPAQSRYAKLRVMNDGSVEYAMNVKLSADLVPVYGSYKLKDVEIEASKAFGQSLAEVTARASGKFVDTGKPGATEVDLGLEIENGRIAEVTATLPVDDTPELSFFSTDVSIYTIVFTPDRNRSDQDKWDPRLKLQGKVKLPDMLGNMEITVGGSEEAASQWLIIDETGPSITGGKVKLPDVRFTLFNAVDVQATDLSIEYDGSKPTDRMLKIQGDLTAILWSGTEVQASFAGPNDYIKLSEKSGVSLAGEIAVRHFVVVPGVFEVEQAKLMMGEEDGVQVFEGSAKLVMPMLPVGNTIEAGLGFYDGSLNMIEFEWGGFNLPLGTTGFFLKAIGGKIEHIADPEPIAFTGTVDMSFGPSFSISLPSWVLNWEPRLRPLVGKPASILYLDDMYVTIDENHLAGGVELASYMGGLITGSCNLDLNWTEGKARADGSVRVFGDPFPQLISLTSNLAADTNGNFFASGLGDLRLPTIPGSRWIKGQELGSGTGVIRFTNDDNLGNDYMAMWGQTSVRLLGNVTVGLALKLDGDYQVLWRKKHVAAYSSAPDVPEGLDEGYGDEGIAAGEFIVPDDAGSLLLAANWTEPVPLGGAVVPPVGIELEDPFGVRYETAADGMFHVKGDPTTPLADSAIIDEFCDEYGKVAGVLNPAAGIWKIVVTDDTGLGDVTFEAWADAAAPTIDVTTGGSGSEMPEGAGSLSEAPVITIDYSAFDDDSDAVVSLFYDDDQTGYDGQLIAADLSETDGDDSYEWDPTGVPAGDYYVYAVIDDGQGPPVFSDYAANAVTVVDSQTGDISGVVYEDANGNGVQDAADSALAGLVIFDDANADGSHDAGEASTTTDAEGRFTLTLPVGETGNLQVAIPTDALPIEGAGGYSVNSQHGVDLAGHDFGVFRRVRIAGVAFDDLNADGVRDAGEPGLPDRTVFIDDNMDGLLTAGESTATTEADGGYTFDDLGPGDYVIAQVAAAGWNSVAPSAVTVASGADVTGANLANFALGMVSGRVFLDDAIDGVSDGDEAGLAVWTVFADLDHDGERGPGEPFAATDGDGGYDLAGLLQDEYVIRVDPPPGYQATMRWPDGGQVVSVTTSGQVMGDVDFGFRPADLINRGFDVADPAAPGFGWTIRGDVAVDAGRAMLSEGATLAGLSQAFVVPDSASWIAFTLDAAGLGLGALHDAVEVSLTDATTGRSLLGPTAGLPFGDAGLNLQAAGQAYAAGELHLSGGLGVGDTVADGAIRIAINLSGIESGSEVVLSVDLLGFGDEAGATVAVDNFGYDDGAVVSGRVLDAAGSGAGGTEVYAVRRGDGVRFTTTADADGRIDWSLPVGVYDFAATIDGGLAVQRRARISAGLNHITLSGAASADAVDLVDDLTLTRRVVLDSGSERHRADIQLTSGLPGLVTGAAMTGADGSDLPLAAGDESPQPTWTHGRSSTDANDMLAYATGGYHLRFTLSDSSELDGDVQLQGGDLSLDEDVVERMVSHRITADGGQMLTRMYRTSGGAAYASGIGGAVSRRGAAAMDVFADNRSADVPTTPIAAASPPAMSVAQASPVTTAAATPRVSDAAEVVDLLRPAGDAPAPTSNGVIQLNRASLGTSSHTVSTYVPAGNVFSNWWRRVLDATPDEEEVDLLQPEAGSTPLRS